MATLAKKRGEVKPVTGGYRWLKAPALPLGLGRIRISAETKKGRASEEYDLGALLCRVTWGNELQHRVVGYRLVKDDDEGYELENGFDGLPVSCTCGDFTFRREGLPVELACKHVLAVRAALRALGV